jgi:biofilm PGA synthesis N-glycosyltransferase PgaC
MRPLTNRRWRQLFIAVLPIAILITAPFVPGFRSLLLNGRATGSLSQLSIVFWGSLALLAYVFLGYPLILAAWSRLKPHPWRSQPFEPSISIVIAAHNEAARIGRKIANLLKLDYPADRLEILVGSDGSTDGTLERLRDISEQRIRIFILPERRGKPAVLNMLVPKARGEIVVLADVRQQFDPEVLPTLMQSFADPEVGAVTGELILTKNETHTTVGEGTGAYWRYEKFIRSCESQIDSTIVVTGAIYAIRKTLFESIPEDTIVDDLLIPLRIARRGYRVVFERQARAYDLAPANTHEEFTRKVRTLAGAFQLFAREKWLFNPAKNRLWWQMISHKALRLLTAPLQVAAFAANMVLAVHSPFFRVMLLAQVLFYGCAIAGWTLPQNQRKSWLVTLPYAFCLLSWATVVGFVRCITNRQTVTWEKASAASSALSSNE